MFAKDRFNSHGVLVLGVEGDCRITRPGPHKPPTVVTHFWKAIDKMQHQLIWSFRFLPSSSMGVSQNQRPSHGPPPHFGLFLEGHPQKGTPSPNLWEQPSHMLRGPRDPWRAGTLRRQLTLRSLDKKRALSSVSRYTGSCICKYNICI